MWDRRTACTRTAQALVLVLALACLVLGALAPGVASADGPSGGAGFAPGSQPAPRNDPFAGRGMWIWVLDATDGGDLAAIVAAAHQYGIGTLMIKSGDGTAIWPQFNRQLVSTLHANHLRVCAWQFVYGQNPIEEAYIGAAAVQDGADCLLIDAENQYETQPDNYVQAQTYIAWLRKLIGPRFPVALAGLPYIDYHPAFPYSVFLGPGGAQYNMPQMYWAEIGASVYDVYAHTYDYNILYGRPIAPVGQVNGPPPPDQIFLFRQLSRVYGAPGVSWWDMAESTTSSWIALSRPAGSLTGVAAQPVAPSLGPGAAGDLVVWTQEHLISAGYPLLVDGVYGALTLAAIQRFQQTHGLQVDGILGPATWHALLRYPAAAVHWTAAGTEAQVARARFSLTMPVPESSHLPAVRDELAGAGGAGSPPGSPADP